MIFDWIYLLGGLALILAGANYLTDGASAVARKFRISDLVIGLTIVAFGTSAPELAISMISAINGNADIALGNIVGSNIFNMLMIVGCTALVMPISVEPSTLSKEIPLVILSSLALYFCALDIFIDGAPTNIISRTDGLLLLCFFLIFMRYTFSIARQPGEQKEFEKKASQKKVATWLAIVYIVGGLAALVFGGDIFVDGASGIARKSGVSESVIALTLVAAGTSLPELATSVVAAIKKNPGIAIGNVVGSSLFNVFFIIGSVATVRPLNVVGITPVDFYVLIGTSVLFWLFGMVIKKRTITRVEGGIMVAAFIAYTVYLIINV